MNSKLLLLFSCLLMLFAASCKNKQPFNRKLWKDGDGLEFKYREAMLDDLLQNRKIKGMHFWQVRDSLGRPQGKRGNAIYYDIFIKYDGYPPSYVKRLFVYFNKDSIATDVKVYEHTEKKKEKD